MIRLARGFTMSTFNARAAILVVAGTMLGLSTSACDKRAEPVLQVGSHNLREDCDVPDAPSELGRAICSGNVVQIHMAIDGILTAEDRATFRSMIHVMEKLWSRDHSYGVGLPWAALEDLQIRAELARYLAQEARTGRLDVPLAEMQELAVQLSRSPGPNQWDGIRLLGLTGAPGQVPFLRETIASNTDKANSVEAIMALALICEPVAGEVLGDLERDSSLGNEESSAVREALHRRSSWAKQWCMQERG